MVGAAANCDCGSVCQFTLRTQATLLPNKFTNCLQITKYLIVISNELLKNIDYIIIFSKKNDKILKKVRSLEGIIIYFMIARASGDGNSAALTFEERGRALRSRPSRDSVVRVSTLLMILWCIRTLL